MNEEHLEKIFKEIFKESNSINDNKGLSEKPHETNKNNSNLGRIEKVDIPYNQEREKWFIEEEGNPESFIEYKNFSWQRWKSNENTKGDPDDGKGFSFYYATHAFDEPNKVYTIPDENHPDEDGGNRVLSMGPDLFDDAVIIVVNLELEDGKCRIISSWKASVKNDFPHYRMYKTHQRIIDRLNSKKSMDESKFQTYYVLRKGLKDSFDPDSYGIVVKSDDVTRPVDGLASYKGKKVYIQKIGSKSECERLEDMIRYCLDHYKRGKEW